MAVNRGNKPHARRANANSHSAATSATAGSAAALRVLYATPEIAPWVKIGGLGDVSRALPDALLAAGADVRVLVPGYPALKRAACALHPLARIAPPADSLLHPCTVVEAEYADYPPLWLLDCDENWAREGSPYTDAANRDWADNALRFGQLSWAAAVLAGGHSPLTWHPDVLHCNDWQTGLAPAYLAHAGTLSAASVIAVHNLAYQGLFPFATHAGIGLPAAAMQINGAEFYGRLSFLKAALSYSDAIVTVSPSYAREIQTAAAGAGLDGLMRSRAASLFGILNGIDDRTWNPARDALIAQPYDANRLYLKAENTRALRTETGLQARPDLPLLGLIGRLVEQKGIDLLLEIADTVLTLPAQLVVLGSGDPALEARLNALAARYPGQVAVMVGYDEGLSHRIEAGADIFVMPSRFEPCGLNQMYSLRYGTVPVVHRVGGLADTVIDADDPAGSARANGFSYAADTAAALLDALCRAVAAWHAPDTWRRLQRNGMQTDYSWKVPAQRYLELYRHAMVSHAEFLSAAAIVPAAPPAPAAGEPKA